MNDCRNNDLSTVREQIVFDQRWPGYHSVTLHRTNSVTLRRRRLAVSDQAHHQS
eukprot:m.471450 g.471450  ORF g.471450 m.471450 type:complete len:54 (+) comp31070_c0_seq1:1859-2020(+)